VVQVFNPTGQLLATLDIWLTGPEYVPEVLYFDLDGEEDEYIEGKEATT